MAAAATAATAEPTPSPTPEASTKTPATPPPDERSGEGLAVPYEVDGIIVERLKYCQKWEGESQVLQALFNEHDIPCLQLDRDEKMDAQGQFSIRVEAFREMLEGRKED